MTITVGGTSGLTFPDSSTQNTAATGFGFKNRIINGAMMIDQRNSGAAVTVPASPTPYAVDRFFAAATQSSKYTVQQNAGAVTPPVGFTKYLGATSSSAYSVLSSDFFFIAQTIEGLNVADLAWGTANAQTVTLSFRVYSSLTGTFGGAIRNYSGARSYPFSYTVSTANTWATVSVTIPGDTSGTWVTDNTGGPIISWGLGVGSTYSGAAGSWASANYVSATGATSVVGTNGATFYITGVQLEKGSTATSFDYRPYGTELALCQRYYQKFTANSGIAGYGSGIARSGTASGIFIKLATTMRSAPTVSYNALYLWYNSDVVRAVDGNSGLYTGNDTVTYFANSSTASMTTGNPVLLTSQTSSSWIDFASEL